MFFLINYMKNTIGLDNILRYFLDYLTEHICLYTVIPVCKRQEARKCELGSSCSCASEVVCSDVEFFRVGINLFKEPDSGGCSFTR